MKALCLFIISAYCFMLFAAIDGCEQIRGRTCTTKDILISDGSMIIIATILILYVIAIWADKRNRHD